MTDDEKKMVLGVIKKMEFVASGARKCPICYGWNVNPWLGETPYAHTKDCKLAKLIKVLES